MVFLLSLFNFQTKKSFLLACLLLHYYCDYNFSAIAHAISVLGKPKKMFFFPIPFYWILKLYDDDSLLFFLNTKTIKQIVMSKIIIIYSNYVIDISFIVFLNIFVLLHITLFFGMLRQSHKNKTLHAVKYISSKQAETTNEQLSEILLAKQHQRMPKSSNKNTFHSFFVIFLFAEKSVLWLHTFVSNIIICII